MDEKRKFLPIIPQVDHYAEAFSELSNKWTEGIQTWFPSYEGGDGQDAMATSGNAKSAKNKKRAEIQEKRSGVLEMYSRW